LPESVFLSILPRMRKTISFIMLCGALAVAFATPSFAAAPKPLGKFGYWSTYQMYEGPNPVCYMSITAKPPTKKGDKKAVKRGDVVLMVTHRPSENTLDVVSYAAGTKFKSASDVVLKMGSKSYSLFTQGDTAWSRDQATDRAVVEALRANTSVTVTGTLANGAPLADTVSLKGIGEAYYAIGKACGLQVTPPKVEKPKVDKTPVKAKKTPEKKR
jgi:hypothetical protein